MCTYHWAPGRVAFRLKAAPVKIRIFILYPFILARTHTRTHTHTHTHTHTRFDQNALGLCPEEAHLDKDSSWHRRALYRSCNRSPHFNGTVSTAEHGRFKNNGKNFLCKQLMYCRSVPNSTPTCCKDPPLLQAVLPVTHTPAFSSHQHWMPG